MKISVAIVAWLFASVCSAADLRPALSMCDVLAKPEKYQKKEIIVAGWMSLSFEDFAFGCRNDSKESKGHSFIWIDFDLASIEKNSPQFMAQLREDIKRANSWKGSAKRNIVVGGKIEFTDEMLGTQKKAAPLSGYGHLGGSPGHFRVTVIKEYGPNQSLEPMARCVTPRVGHESRHLSPWLTIER